MERTFEEWSEIFDSAQLFEFNGKIEGLVWLKVKAVSRKSIISKFIAAANIKLQATKLKEMQEELYKLILRDSGLGHALDAFLKDRGNEWYKLKKVDEEQLRQDLNQITIYQWGGDRNNSLDRNLVEKYVKNICDYKSLLAQKNNIAMEAWAYVQNSWYNNWTSYLIESLFEKHTKVLSAVGEIKNVDFFIEDTPIDLKVTYYPKDLMSRQLKEKLGVPLVTWLKQNARKAGIDVKALGTPSNLAEILCEKMNQAGLNAPLEQLNQIQNQIITEAMDNSIELMKWYYEKQGEMRFGAENRLFLVLIDVLDLNASWKMKRAFHVIEPIVKEYLDNFSVSKLKKIEFKYHNHFFHAFADTIFIVKR